MTPLLYALFVLAIELLCGAAVLGGSEDPRRR